MLGSVESPRRWQWVAFGKHPVARDFFRLGPEVAMAGGFSEWVESGYRSLPAQARSAADFHAFRFWARGPGKDGLVLGVVRDSSDDIGRSYPFLTMGVGPLKDWEEHWDLLPLACEMSWGRIEYLSSGTIKDFRRMETEVAERLRPPLPDWEGLSERRRAMTTPAGGLGPGAGGPSMDLREMERQASAHSREAEILLNLDAAGSVNLTSTVALWNFLLRKCGTSTPSAVFLGGSLGVSCLALYRRALAPRDFVRLWTTPEWGEGGRP